MRRRGLLSAAAAAVTVLAVTSLTGDQPVRDEPPDVIGGPYARLLTESADLGPAHAQTVEVSAELHRNARPVRLNAWAQSHGLTVRWHDGEDWAVIEGPAEEVADAFGVPLRDYRIRDGADAGRVFYASPAQPAIPSPARAEVAGLGRILSYTPTRSAFPVPPREVPDGGLLPSHLLNAYNATPLIRDGNTGAGQTVVVFAFDGFRQADLDSFAEMVKLPRFVPDVIGGMPERVRGEANMDLQVIHAVAPDARLVLVNAWKTTDNEGEGAFEKLAGLMDSITQRFPGAVWSMSIGWGCDRLFAAANLAPIRAALRRALAKGTTAFDASGDLAGLECKSGQKWSDPPAPDDVGVDAVASLPEMTSVGGTKLSTDADGNWIAEQAWYDGPLIQGTAGGASTLYERPPWQAVGVGTTLPNSRLVPDVSAVADPLTGVRIVLNNQTIVGGGTSQAAPIWAGLAALMNQSLIDRGSPPLGNLNPLLYKVAKTATLPGFRDISMGGNAIMPSSTTGYDMVTGLGTPNIANLLRDIELVRAVS